MAEPVTDSRLQQVGRGRRLEYFTIAWNSIEGIVAVIAGAMAGSISLLAFGIDGFIEVLSGWALLWRMSADADVEHRHRSDKRALRIVGLCFIALAVYIAYESGLDLLRHRAPEHSVAGIVLACVSLLVMPLLSLAKHNVGTHLGSAAMHADAQQTAFCAYLSAILLSGLVMNAAFGLWWTDPVAALMMVPLIAREGIEALRGQPCRNC
jgi:divalent metal cation (Fe/Co/Zn/Cd) transporter